MTEIKEMVTFESIQGESEIIVQGKEALLPLTSEKGNYLCGKFLGLWTMEWNDKKTGITKSSDAARFAMIQTNMTDNGQEIAKGEIVNVFASGLLFWGLRPEKVTVNDVLAIKYNGKSAGLSESGETRNYNNFTIVRLTELQVHKLLTNNSR